MWWTGHNNAEKRRFVKELWANIETRSARYKNQEKKKPAWMSCERQVTQFARGMSQLCDCIDQLKGVKGLINYRYKKYSSSVVLKVVEMDLVIWD